MQSDKDRFGMSVQELTLKATLLGKIAAWNELAKWMVEADSKMPHYRGYYSKDRLVELIIEKTDELNAEFQIFTSEDSE
jgi:hypothetical protein